MSQENYIREKLNEIIDNIRTEDNSVYGEPDYLHLFNYTTEEEFQEIKAMLEVMVKYSERLIEIQDDCYGR